MKKAAMCSFLVFVCSALLAAQPGERQRPEPNYDELIKYLGLDAAQVACLEANRDSFRKAVEPYLQELVDLQKQLRQAARDGADTTAIQSRIDSARSSIETARNSHVLTAQACVGGASAVKGLVEAEMLMNEVRQAIGLMLLQPTDEKAFGAWPGPPRGRRSPGGRPNGN